MLIVTLRWQWFCQGWLPLITLSWFLADRFVNNSLGHKMICKLIHLNSGSFEGRVPKVTVLYSGTKRALHTCAFTCFLLKRSGAMVQPGSWTFSLFSITTILMVLGSTVKLLLHLLQTKAASWGKRLGDICFMACFFFPDESSSKLREQAVVLFQWHPWSRMLGLDRGREDEIILDSPLLMRSSSLWAEAGMRWLQIFLTCLTPNAASAPQDAARWGESPHLLVAVAQSLGGAKWAAEEQAETFESLNWLWWWYNRFTQYVEM